MDKQIKKTDHRKFYGCLLLAAVVLCTAFIRSEKPTLYLVGDSTVSGGWGRAIVKYFDTTQINIVNRAVAGTSSRTYYTKLVHQQSMTVNGMWQGVVDQLKPGDYVMIQFGHNDDGPLADTLRSRGSLRGIGNDSVIVHNPFTKANETVHSYGWYLNRFITETRAKGATVIICSPIPMDRWKEGKRILVDTTYGKWSAEIAAAAEAYFIDLNKLIASEYEKEDQAHVSSTYFIADHVHTSAAGSAHNARVVADAIKHTKKLKLRKYLN